MKYTFRFIDSINGFDGCPGHDEPADKTDDHFSVNCPRCEPHLGPHMWFASPNLVPLTHDEKLEAERFEREAAKNQALLAQSFAQALPALVAQHAQQQASDPAPARSRRKPAN